MSNYPNSVDSFAPVTGTDEMSEHAERHTAEESAIVATQQELDVTKALLDSHTHDPQDLTHDHDAEYQAKGDYALDSHTHPPQDTTHDHLGEYAGKAEFDAHHHDGEYSEEGHTHASDDSKLDKGATTYIDAKAIQDDIDGIESYISDLSDNYDQLVIDLGNASGDLTVELAGYLKKGLASYADAAGIEAEIDQEKNNRADGDADTLTSANAYTDGEIAKIVVPDTSNLVTQAELTAEEDARKAADAALQANIDAINVYDETALKGRVDANEGNITSLQAEQVTQNTAIQDNKDAIDAIVIPNVDDFATTDYVDNADATKFDKGTGTTNLNDATAMEAAIDKNAADIAAISASGGYNDGWIQTAIDAGDATTLSSANTYTNEEIAKIPATDVSDLATKDELTAGLTGKADEPHTHDDLAAGDHNHDSDYSAADHDHDADYAGKAEFDAHTHDTSHDHDSEYQPVGDYATNADLTSGLATKSDTTHTHDTTHDHDAVYQPLGDYATKNELAVVDGKADANTSKNTEQDGKIAALESANESLDNKVEALENALISAKYKVEIQTGKAPREGYVRLDDGDPNNISLMVFNPKDANGVTHDFSGVKDGDKLTVATSSAVGTYNILSATTGSLSVTPISGNGTFAADDVVDVKVSPEFDASSYATNTYVDAQDATKFDKGATGPTTYTTAELMEAAIDTNKAAINDNADAIKANTATIDALNTSTLSLSVPVDVRASTLSTQEDANEYFASQLETKLSKAPTWGELAGRP